MRAKYVPQHKQNMWGHIMENILKSTFPKNTVIELGRRKIRTKKESDSHVGLKAKQLESDHPQCYPPTWLDVSGMIVGKVLIQGGSGYVVDEQKSVRKLTAGQATEYRTSMVNKYPNLAKKYATKNDEGETIHTPFHVINCRTVGARIDLTGADKLEIIKDRAPDLYKVVFAGMNDEAKLANVDAIWDQLAAVK